jgi:LPXTG-motif cell wall-anchored protein
MYVYSGMGAVAVKRPAKFGLQLGKKKKSLLSRVKIKGAWLSSDKKHKQASHALAKAVAVKKVAAAAQAGQLPTAQQHAAINLSRAAATAGATAAFHSATKAKATAKRAKSRSLLAQQRGAPKATIDLTAAAAAQAAAKAKTAAAAALRAKQAALVVQASSQDVSATKAATTALEAEADAHKAAAEADEIEAVAEEEGGEDTGGGISPLLLVAGVLGAGAVAYLLLRRRKVTPNRRRRVRRNRTRRGGRATSYQAGDRVSVKYGGKWTSGYVFEKPWPSGGVLVSGGGRGMSFIVPITSVRHA